LGTPLLAFFEVLFDLVQVFACFLCPFPLRILVQIVPPVGCGAIVKKKLLAGQGTVEQGDAIIGFFDECLTQRFNGLTVIKGVIRGLTAHIVRRSEVG
jgi:hypothetical protein